MENICIVCGEKATGFVRDLIELTEPDNPWKRYTPGKKTWYCDKHYPQVLETVNDQRG